MEKYPQLCNWSIFMVKNNFCWSKLAEGCVALEFCPSVLYRGLCFRCEESVEWEGSFRDNGGKTTEISCEI